MSGCALQHRKNWQVIFRIRSNKHVEVVSKKIFISGRIPSKDNYVNQIKHKKPKPEKGKKRGDKTPCHTDSAAAKLLPLMQRIHLPNNNPFFLIFRLYKAQFLDNSVRRNLINPRRLSLAGDGTPLETARLERPKRICGGIQQEFFNMKPRKIGFHGEKGMQE